MHTAKSSESSLANSMVLVSGQLEQPGCLIQIFLANQLSRTVLLGGQSVLE